MVAVTVEAIDRHDDGSVTILGVTVAGEPVAHTFPPGAKITVLQCVECGRRLRAGCLCPVCES